MTVAVMAALQLLFSVDLVCDLLKVMLNRGVFSAQLHVHFVLWTACGCNLLRESWQGSNAGTMPMA